MRGIFKIICNFVLVILLFSALTLIGTVHVRQQEHLASKTFGYKNIDIVKYGQYCFGFEMPSELWAKRISKLNEKNR